jgi:hypothetical protein
MDGHIGRHQQAPDRVTLAQPAALSRRDLEGELERLRAICAADKAQDNA